MFENFENFKNAKAPAWMIPLIFVAIGAHAAFGAVIVIKQMWAAPLLDVPVTPLDVAVAPPPPPPPPPPKGSKKLETQKPKEPRKIKVTETVQPVKPEEIKPQETASADDNDEGDEDGEEGGVAGGIPGGIPTPAPPPPPPPPPPPQAPQIVPPSTLDQQRISGDKNILPDDVTRTEISRSGKTRLTIPVKVCIDKSGDIASVSLSKASGFIAYDEKLKREIRKWRYRPFMINGAPAPVCSVVLFVYNQKS